MRREREKLESKKLHEDEREWDEGVKGRGETEKTQATDEFGDSRCK